MGTSIAVTREVIDKRKSASLVDQVEQWIPTEHRQHKAG